MLYVVVMIGGCIVLELLVKSFVVEEIVVLWFDVKLCFYENMKLIMRFVYG